MTTLTGSDVQKLVENCRPWRVQQLQGLIEKENSNEQFFNFSTELVSTYTDKLWPIFN